MRISRAASKGHCGKNKQNALRIHPLFDLIASTGDIPERDMFNTFNMGVGMCLIVSREDADRALEILRANSEEAYICGDTVLGEGIEIC